MSRTRIRVVLILVILILVIASILSSLLTYWVGLKSEAPDTPGDGDAGRNLLRGDPRLMQSWHSKYTTGQSLPDACSTG